MSKLFLYEIIFLRFYRVDCGAVLVCWKLPAFLSSVCKMHSFKAARIPGLCLARDLLLHLASTHCCACSYLEGNGLLNREGLRCTALAGTGPSVEMPLLTALFLRSSLFGLGCISYCLSHPSVYWRQSRECCIALWSFSSLRTVLSCNRFLSFGSVLIFGTSSLL